MVHTEGLLYRLMIQMGDCRILLIQFGFAQAKDIRGNITFLFKNVTKFQALFVDKDSIDVSKFTTSSISGFRENEFVAKMIAVCIGRVGGLMACEYVVMSGWFENHYDDALPVCGLGAVSGMQRDVFAAWEKFPSCSRPASAMVASKHSPSAGVEFKLGGEPARCFLEAGAWQRRIMAGDWRIAGGRKMTGAIRRTVRTHGVKLHGRCHWAHRKRMSTLKKETDFFFKTREHIVEFTFGSIWGSSGRGPHMRSSIPNGVGDKLFI
jgi:hypothetical protein